MNRLLNYSHSWQEFWEVVKLQLWDSIAGQNMGANNCGKAESVFPFGETSEESQFGPTGCKMTFVCIVLISSYLCWIANTVDDCNVSFWRFIISMQGKPRINDITILGIRVSTSSPGYLYGGGNAVWHSGMDEDSPTIPSFPCPHFWSTVRRVDIAALYLHKGNSHLAKSVRFRATLSWKINERSHKVYHRTGSYVLH